jgi:putative tryptophan/tyrosine transport system substrate-binding protein
VLMRRRDVVAGLGALAVAWPLAAHGQQRGSQSPPVLLFVAVVPPLELLGGLRRALASLGYVDGQTIVIQEHIGSLSEIPAQLARRKVDVVFAASPAAVRAAWESAKAVPIVAYDLETDPLQSGYIRSFAQPGGNLTGVFLDQPELTGKWLQLLKEAVPGLSRVAVLWDADTGTSQLDAITRAAATLETRLHVFRLRPDLEGLLDEIKTSGAEGLILLSSPIAQLRGGRMADLAQAHRLPTISMFRQFTQREGGLLSYGADLVPLRERAAIMVGKILKGENPGRIPIERPTTFELRINLKTAAALGLSLPPLMLQRADEVIE